MARPRLIRTNVNNVDVFYSYDFGKEHGYYDPSILRIDVEDFLENLTPKYRELIDLNARRHQLTGMAMLLAHGSAIDGNYVYFAGENYFRLQNWINRRDGSYAVIILGSCNPEHTEISSKKSAILVPNDVYSHADAKTGDVQIELFILGLGYVDPYTIDYSIQKMRELLESQ